MRRAVPLSSTFRGMLMATIRLRVTAGSLLVGLLVGVPVLSAANWPRFRGPDGTGVAADRGIPVRWNGEDVAWKTAIPGVGNSSPVVWGDRLFIQSAAADGSQRWLFCLRTRDGKIHWSRSVAGSPARKHPKNSLASSTPSVDGERVYALFWDGRAVSLAAFDFQGDPVWTYDLGAFTSQHGPGTSPIVYDGVVYVANDQDGAARLVALDARTGKLTWEAPRRAFRASYSTPFILERPGAAPELIVVSTAGVTSYAPRTGAENWDWVWRFRKAPLRTVASPLFADGLIVVSSGDGGGDRHTVALRPPAKGGPAGAAVAWEFNHSFPYVPTMLARGPNLYYVNDKGIAACCRLQTGEEVWKERLGGNVTASPVLVDGKVYAVDEGGTVYVIEAAPRFRLLARNSLGEPVMATPAVADNRLFIRGHDHVFCIARAPAK